MTTSVKRARVLLVDDHPEILRQTVQLLENQFEVVDTLEDGTNLLDAVARQDPDLIVLDITLPGLGGIDWAVRLKAANCRAQIIFLTVHQDPDYVREAFLVGAIGYVVKPRLASDLIPALNAALMGKRFLSPCPEFEDFS